MPSSSASCQVKVQELPTVSEETRLVYALRGGVCEPAWSSIRRGRPFSSASCRHAQQDSVSGGHATMPGILHGYLLNVISSLATYAFCLVVTHMGSCCQTYIAQQPASACLLPLMPCCSSVRASTPFSMSGRIWLSCWWLSV